MYFNGTTITDVSYGTNVNYYNVNENLKLDIYIPPILVANQKFPLVVFFHGGGFLPGDKSVSANICKSIANNGFVTATVNYRLGRDTGLLATTCDDSIEGINSALYRAVQDAKASLRFLISNAASYSIDTNWVFLDGQSSGANIALNTAFLSQDSANVYLPGCQAKLGSINNATNNLTTTYTLKGIGDFWGSISSVYFITPANAIPIIFTHGRLDPVAPFNSGHQNSCPKFPIVYGSLAMYNRLLSLGVPTVLHEDSTGKHGNIFDDTFNATNMCCFFNSLIYNQPESGYYVGRISSCVPLLFFHDGDSDGYGKLADSIRAQSPPLGYVANSADCNDANASINPSLTEVCNGIDDNCNGQIDEGVQTVFFHDADGDGFGNVNDTVHRCAAPVGYVTNNTDCNDGNALINPSATEVCNGIDDNCNGQIDEGFTQFTFFHDTDGDGYGNENDTVHACAAPVGYVSDATDCNDGNASVNPSATEICNGIDDNCNGQIDEGLQTVFYHDADGDGFGNGNDTIHRCAAPVGYVSDATDCDDGNASVNPSATEICNGIDDNCNGQIDEGVQTVFFHDADGDGFGNVNDTVHACTAPVGYVSDATDCNDGNVSINPSATEVCNGIDDNCNGQIDEGVQTVFFHDADGDGFGNVNDTIHSCTAPLGYVSDSTDCNDGNVSINPSATEICNGIDDNCNGQIDEGVQQTFYRDVDNDGFGNLLITTLACSKPVGYVTNSADCNDGNASINPSAKDICNGIDDNCNGQIDENAIAATISPSGTVSICNGTSTILTANSGLGINYQWIKNGTNITGAKGQTYTTNGAGNYKVKETNGFSCSSTSATTIVSLKTQPTATITPLTSLDICVATKVILEANSGTGLTYLWTKNGTPISGSTKRKCTTTVIGTFRVIVTGSNGCGKTSDSVKVIKSCARSSNSVSNGNAAPDNVVSTSPSLLSLNPNPSAGIVTLNYSSTLAERVQISVYDIPGKILYNKSEQAISGKNAFRLNLSALIPGVYYIELRNSLQQQRIMLKIER